MKKILGLTLILVIVFLTGCEKVEGDIKLGVSRYAPHGERSFAITTVVMNGDLIEQVMIDEYQFLAKETNECVPNGETTFAKEETCLASKRVNNEAYSINMTERGGATQDLKTSYIALEEFAKGKTVQELVEFIEGKESEELVDTVSGSTLVDNKGYIEAIIAAVNSIE